MKRILVLLLMFAILPFATTCGSSKKKGNSGTLAVFPSKFSIDVPASLSPTSSTTTSSVKKSKSLTKTPNVKSITKSAETTQTQQVYTDVSTVFSALSASSIMPAMYAVIADAAITDNKISANSGAQKVSVTLTSAMLEKMKKIMSGNMIDTTQLESAVGMAMTLTIDYTTFTSGTYTSVVAITIDGETTTVKWNDDNSKSYMVYPVTDESGSETGHIVFTYDESGTYAFSEMSYDTTDSVIHMAMVEHDDGALYYANYKYKTAYTETNTQTGVTTNYGTVTFVQRLAGYADDNGGYANELYMVNAGVTTKGNNYCGFDATGGDISGNTTLYDKYYAEYTGNNANLVSLAAKFGTQVTSTGLSDGNYFVINNPSYDGKTYTSIDSIQAHVIGYADVISGTLTLEDIGGSLYSPNYTDVMYIYKHGPNMSNGYADSLYNGNGIGDLAYATTLNAPDPVNVTLTTMKMGANSIVLNWNNPVDSRYSYVKVSVTDSASNTTTGSGVTVSTTTVSGLTASTYYTVKVAAYDDYSTVIGSDSFYITTPSSDSITYYFLTSASDLKSMNKDRNYLLIKDVDLGGYSWTPFPSGYTAIGYNTYGATFDGNGHTISGFTIDYSSKTATYPNVGFFSNITGTVKNLTVSGTLSNTYSSESDWTSGLLAGAVIKNYTTPSVINCHSKGSVSTLRGNAGGLIGSTKDATISNCSSSATVTMPSGALTSAIGGFLGSDQDSTITNCFATGAVTCYQTTASAGSDCGGFTGNLYKGIHQYCYATGAVTVSGSGTYAYAGGFAGVIDYPRPIYCYSKGNVSVNGSYSSNICAGGFSGLSETSGDAKYCYSACVVTATNSGTGSCYIGGFQANYTYTFTPTACYYDSDISTTTAGKGTGLSTANMKVLSNFSGWDSAIWTVGSLNGGYPYLISNPPTE